MWNLNRLFTFSFLLFTLIWGRTGFDRMFGESRLRVRALFSVINEQNNLSATNNVVPHADFSVREIPATLAA